MVKMVKQEQLKERARDGGFRILDTRPGMCDFQNVSTGMVHRDVPLEDALEYFDFSAQRETLCSATKHGVATWKYDIFGMIPCHDAHRTRRKYVFLLHERQPSPAPWALKTPFGTRCFYDFKSMAAFAVGVYGRERNLTGKQYATVSRAYSAHIHSGKPFVMPEL